MKKRSQHYLIIVIILILSTTMLFSFFYNENINENENNRTSLKLIKSYKIVNLTQISDDEYNYSMPKLGFDGNAIYYISNEGSNGLQFWSMALDGSNRKQITLHKNGVDTYDISYNSELLVYSKRDEIYILNLKNNSINKLHQGWEPSFSPNGSKVIYVSWTDTCGIFMPAIDMISIDGKNYSEVAGWLNPDISNPIFSSDGLKIIYKCSSFQYPIIPSKIERIDINSGQKEMILNNTENITYFDLGLNANDLIFVENGNLVIIDMENNIKKTLLDIDKNIDYFDINFHGNKIVLTINGKIWIGEIRESLS